MKMNKTTVAAAVAASISGGAIQTAQAAITTIGQASVTSGSFGMAFFTGYGFLPFIGPGTDSDITAFSAFSSNNTAAATGTGTCATGAVTCFDFGAAQTNVFMAAGSTQLGDGTGRVNLSGQTYDDAGGATSVNLSGWYANWNGTDFNQGPNDLTGPPANPINTTLTTSNCVSGDCDFTMSWMGIIAGGPFDGNTGSWKVSGTISAVPVPAAAWLMGSGLVGLAGVGRRRKQKS